MEIRDKQGLACPDEQVLHLEFCTCSNGTFCASKVAAVRSTSANFGAAGIIVLILGFFCLICEHDVYFAVVYHCKLVINGNIVKQTYI